jgi:hypothetical protein
VAQLTIFTPLLNTSLKTFTMTTASGKDGLAPIELERADTLYDVHLDHKVQDGDEALKILHGEYEPYTKDEEKRVLRKIDFRLILVMLIINGLQFIDKNVSLTTARCYVDTIRYN